MSLPGSNPALLAGSLAGGKEVGPRGTSRWWLVGAAVVTVLLSMEICRPTLQGAFLSDDYVLLYFARHAGWRDVLDSYLPGLAAQPVSTYYRPVALTIWKVSLLAFGEGPFAHHLFNAVLHATNALLVLLLALRLGESTRSALTAALLFACFPTHAEAVNWVSCRFDLTAVLFALGCLLCGLREGRGAAYLAALLAGLSLGCKESTAVLPILLLLVLWVRDRRLTSAHVPRVLPTVGVVGSILLARVVLLHGPGGFLAGKVWTPASLVHEAGAVLRAAVDFVALPFSWSYLAGVGDPLPARSWAGAGGLALMAMGAIRAAPREPRSGVQRPWRHGILMAVWCGSSLALTLGTVRWNPTTLESTRYLYLPSVGLAIAVAGVLCHGEVLVRSGHAYRRLRGFGSIVLLGVLFFSIAALRASGLRWRRASVEAEEILLQVRGLVVRPEPDTTFLLPSLPASVEGAHVFRNGLQEALRLAYGDPTLNVLGVPRNGDRFVALWREKGRLVRLPGNHPWILDHETRWWNPAVERTAPGEGLRYEGGRYRVVGEGRLLFLGVRVPTTVDVELRLAEGSRVRAVVVNLPLGERRLVEAPDSPGPVLRVGGVLLPRGDSSLALKAAGDGELEIERVVVRSSVCTGDGGRMPTREGVSWRVLPADGQVHPGQQVSVRVGRVSNGQPGRAEGTRVLLRPLDRGGASLVPFGIENERQDGPCRTVDYVAVVPMGGPAGAYAVVLTDGGKEHVVTRLSVQGEESLQPWR